MNWSTCSVICKDQEVKQNMPFNTLNEHDWSLPRTLQTSETVCDINLMGGGRSTEWQVKGQVLIVFEDLL